MSLSGTLSNARSEPHAESGAKLKRSAINAARMAAIQLSSVDGVKGAFASRDNAMSQLYIGAEHGFNCRDRASYNLRAAALAHRRTHVLAEQL